MPTTANSLHNAKTGTQRSRLESGFLRAHQNHGWVNGAILLSTRRLQSRALEKDLHNLIPPHGSKLVDLIVEGQLALAMREESRDWPSMDLNPRQLCDLELLLNGGYSPLEGYMGSQEYASVCAESRLTDGTLWPVPINLDVADELADGLKSGDSLALRDGEGVMLARLIVEEIFEPDREAEVQAIFGSADPSRSEVAQHLHRATRRSASGRIEGLQLPVHQFGPASCRFHTPHAAQARCT